MQPVVAVLSCFFCGILIQKWSFWVQIAREATHFLLFNMGLLLLTVSKFFLLRLVQKYSPEKYFHRTSNPDNLMDLHHSDCYLHFLTATDNTLHMGQCGLYFMVQHIIHLNISGCADWGYLCHIKTIKPWKNMSLGVPGMTFLLYWFRNNFRFFKSWKHSQRDCEMSIVIRVKGLLNCMFWI